MFSTANESKTAFFYMDASERSAEGFAKIAQAHLAAAHDLKCDVIQTEDGCFQLVHARYAITLTLLAKDNIATALPVFWQSESNTADKSDTAQALLLSVSDLSDETDATSAKTLLAAIAGKLAQIDNPECLQWLSQSAWVDGRDFVKLFAPAPVRPARPKCATTSRSRRPEQAKPQFVPLSEHAIIVNPNTATAMSTDPVTFDANLRATFREIWQDMETSGDDQSEQTPAMRLATWSMSYSVAAFSLPVAGSLVAYNLMRGENLRLNSQLMALTGLMVTLSHTGAFRQIASAFGI